jgi:WD40 repeat protein
MSFLAVGPSAPPIKIEPSQTHLLSQWKHTAPLVGCRFDPSGQFVFAGAQDNAVVRYHLGTGKKTELKAHKSWVRALAFAAKENLLFSGDWAGRLIAWPFDADAPAPRWNLAAHKGWVRALAVSPDGKALASCGNDLLVKLWSIPDGKLLATLSGHAWHVYNVAFHPGGKQLVSADLHGVVKVWDLAKQKVARELDARLLYKYDNNFRADHGGVRSMAFNGDGSLLACAGITNVSNAFAGIGNPLVVLFDFASGKHKQLLRPKINFNGTAWGVAFHPKGFILGVGGGNGGVLWAWKPEAAQAFYTLVLPNNARDLSLHPDGRRLAVPFYDGFVRIYDMGPKKA